jgi:hypothetical protein
MGDQETVDCELHDHDEANVVPQPAPFPARPSATAGATKGHGQRRIAARTASGSIAVVMYGPVAPVMLRVVSGAAFTASRMQNRDA